MSDPGIDLEALVRWYRALSEQELLELKKDFPNFHAVIEKSVHDVEDSHKPWLRRFVEHFWGRI